MEQCVSIYSMNRSRDHQLLIEKGHRHGGSQEEVLKTEVNLISYLCQHFQTAFIY